MKVKVKGFSYKIIAESREAEDEKIYFGLCDNSKQEIFINTNKDLSNERIRQTIIHELTHAFHFEYFGCNVFENETEMIAEFVSIYAEDIISLTGKVFEYAKKQKEKVR